MKDTDFNQWRHHPMTAAYLQFLEDQMENFRQGASDLWEMGRLDQRDSDVLRGRVMTLRELRNLTHASIADFYEQGTLDSQDQ